MRMNDLLYVYIVVFAVLYFGITTTIKTIIGERVIKHENAHPDKQEVVKKVEKKLDVVAKVFIILASIYLVNRAVIPGILDIPIIIKSNYSEVEGEAVTQSPGGSLPLRTSIVTVKDFESGQEIRLRFFKKKNVYVGDKLKFVYLPNSKHGTLVEHRQTGKKDED